MKQIKISNTYFESGEPKYIGGKLYPVTEDTLRQVALKNGEEVDVSVEIGAEPAAGPVEAAADEAQAEPVAAQAPAPAQARKRAAN